MALLSTEQGSRETETPRRQRRQESFQSPAKSVAPPISCEMAAPRKPALEARAYLDQNCKISGKLVFEGAVRIDGQIDGEIVARESLVIGESAVLMPQITAASIIVEGRVTGDVTASKCVEIRSSGKVSGTITTPKLIVHEGASFEGHCAMPKSSADEEAKRIPLNEGRAMPDSLPDIAAPRALAQSDAGRGRLMCFLRSITDALLLLGPDGAILFANEEAEGCLGLPAGGLATGKLLEALLGEANALVRVVNTARSAETGLFDVPIEMHDGRAVVHLLVSVFVTGCGPAGATLLAVIRDLNLVRREIGLPHYDIEGTEPES